MPFGKAGWFEPAKPVKVEGGIRARSKRGTIGEQWWSRRFIDILERICDPGRLARGRAYARAGQVLDLAIAPGAVRARVQGSRPEPYKVRVAIATYQADEWESITAALGARALYRAKLLAGEMPPDIEEVFGDCGLPLFPEQRGLEMSCSCPDWGFPCKHLSAVLYLLAEAFDEDPFLVLAWRGMGRDTLLAALRATPTDETGTTDEAEPWPLDVEDVPFADRLADFYDPGVSTGRLRESPTRTPAPPDLLLRTLDPPPVKARHIPILDLLRPAYRKFGEEITDPRSAGEPSP
jgi:uncharacterized Zn finger protein